MNISFFLICFSLLALVYFVVGLHASRSIKTTDDYFLASRGLGFIPLTFTLLATQLGGGAILGVAQEAYSVGVFGVLYTLGMATGFLILGLGFASKFRAFSITTVSELYELKYHSPFLRKTASLLSTFSLCGILAAQVVAARGVFLGLGIAREELFILFWVLVVTYTMFGGLKAVVATDVVQILFIIAILITVFGYALVRDPSVLFKHREFTAFIDQDYFSFNRLFPFFLMPTLLSLIEQDLAQRFFAAKNKRVAFLSTITAGIVLILFSSIPVYFGMQARLLGIAVPTGANPFVVVLEHTMNGAVVSLVICGLFAAITSTADSILCAISSHVVQDFNLFSEHNALAASKYVTAFVGVAALWVAYFFTSIIEVMSQSYELLVSTLFVSVMFCFFSHHPSRRGALLSVFVGATSFFVFRFVHPFALPRELSSLISSLCGYVIGCVFDDMSRQKKKN